MDIIQHYRKYFFIRKADTPELKKKAFQLRYKVFIEECNYSIGNCNHSEKTESDLHDNYALHSLLFHKSNTDKPIGYIRLIPYCKEHFPLLPIEESGKFHFYDSILTDQLRTPRTGEVSRMAILPLFRRRLYDTGIHGSTSEQEELIGNRRFKIDYLPMSLILSSISFLFDKGLDYTVVMLERPLFLLLKRLGVCSQQIGDYVEYNGLRAPFMLFPSKTFDNLKPEFKELFNVIHQELKSTEPIQGQSSLE